MKKRTHISDLLALLLLGVFAACVLAVLLSGAGAYRRLTGRDDAAYDRRTAAQYLTTRVRQADAAGMVSVRDFTGSEPAVSGDTLVLTEVIDGTAYATLVYCHDGYLRELFSDGSWESAPEDGEKVLEAQALAFTQGEDGLLTVEITAPDGAVDRLFLTLRSGEEATP